jgi:hypothetical protein
MDAAVERALMAQRPFKGILQEEIGRYLSVRGVAWDGCCCPACLVAAPQGAGVGFAQAVWMDFFGAIGEPAGEYEPELLELRRRIQDRFLVELGALEPPPVPTGSTRSA